MEDVLSVITNDMSSEDSGRDDNTIVVHPIPWQKEYVTKMFMLYDRLPPGGLFLHQSCNIKCRFSCSVKTNPSQILVFLRVFCAVLEKKSLRVHGPLL